MFAGWAGSGCSGTGTTCHVLMTADEGVTATFNQKHPDVVTGSASGVTDSAATVGGTVNPNGSNVTDCHIDYGTSQSYGSTVACSPSPGAGSSAVAVSGSLSGLAQGTTYHYRVVATNGGGTTDGSDATFTTTTQTILPPPRCPLDLLPCPRPNLTLDGFSSKTMLLRLTCHGFAGQPACGGRLTFKAVVKVRVKRGRKTRIVKKTIVVSTVSYDVAAGGTGSVKLKLTSAAKTALKSGPLTARASGLSRTIHLPKTAVRKKKKH
jgi:hypothetical protein